MAMKRSIPTSTEGIDHVKGALGPLLPKVNELLKLVECKLQSLKKELQIARLQSLKREMLCLQNKLEFLQKEEVYTDPELGKLQLQFWGKVVHNFFFCLEDSEPIPDIDTFKRLVADLQSAEKIPTDAMIEDVKGALGPLFQKVIELLKLVECKMQIELNKEVDPQEPYWESLKTELVSLRSKLRSLEKDGKYIDSPKDPRLEIQIWAELRELSYDVEDVVDNFLVCLESFEPIV